VVAHVQALDAGGWKVPTLFGKAVVQPAASEDVNTYSFYRNGSEFGSPDTWLELLRQTEKVFEIMGIHLGPWRGNKGFSDLLAKKAEEGCAVRVLLMHPDNPTLPDMINETLTDVDLEVTIREINEMAKYFARIAEKSPNIAVRQIRRGTLHCQTTRTDLFGMYLPYLYSQRRRYCPLWQCKPGSALYDLVVEEFEGLWRVNGAGS